MAMEANDSLGISLTLDLSVSDYQHKECSTCECDFVVMACKIWHKRVLLHRISEQKKVCEGICEIHSLK